MANSTDSSVWRNLAVALGDGLAFGVGFKLTQAGGRQQAPPTRTGRLLLERVVALEGRLDEMRRAVGRPSAFPPAPGVDRQAFEGIAKAIADAVDARLQEQAAGTEQRLAEFENRLDQLKQSGAIANIRIAEIKDAYRELVAELRQRLEEEWAALGQRLTGVHTELCEALPGAIDAAIERKLGGMRLEADRKDREIAELRAQIVQSDTRVKELLEAIGQAVCAAAGRISSPPAEQQPAAAVPEPVAAAADDSAPAFAATADAEPLWRVALVFALIVTGGGLALLRYL